MTKKKNTPGPWAQDNVTQLHVVQRGGDGHFIADCSIQSVGDVDVELANARLIAAAPMMLDRLQTILELVDSGGLGEGVNANAKALLEQYLSDAIAKATGGDDK